MNTYQLQCVIQCDPCMKTTVLGVFPADRLPSIPHQRPVGFIANTDPSHAPGRHWVAFFFDVDGSIECFDSYGKSPNELSEYIKLYVSRFTEININKKRLQNSFTAVCGQYCLYYLICRCRGISMNQTLQIFDRNLLMNDQFVFDFVNDRFFCCVGDNCGNNQVCTVETPCR